MTVNGNNVYFDSRAEMAKWKLRNWWSDTKVKVKEFWEENRDYIVVLAPVIIGAGSAAVKAIERDQRIKEEKDLKERYIYDRSLGTYYEMRRQPKQSEYAEISRRKSNGESLGEILKDMRLMK